MRAIATDGIAWSVLSFCWSREPCKNGWWIEMPFWGLTRVVPRNHVLWHGVQISPEEWAILGLSMPLKNIRSPSCSVHKNGWTDWDAVWRSNLCGPRSPLLDVSRLDESIRQREGWQAVRPFIRILSPLVITEHYQNKNWLQFLFIVKASVLKQQMSKFYLLIQRTEASDHIYFSRPVINVKAIFCA